MSSHENEIASASHPPGPLARIFERLVYGSRWLLIPMYIGLLVVLLLYVGQYVMWLWELCKHFRTLKETDLMLSVLSAVDTVMLGSMLAFIMIGSYSIFVRPLAVGADAPGGLKGITSGTLKTKISTSLIGISSIYLLRDFVGVDQCTMETLYKHVGLHLVFLISALALAVTDKLTHSNGR